MESCAKDKKTNGDKASLDVAGNERLVLGESLEELDVGVRADDLVLGESLAQDTESLGTRGAVDDELGDEGIVEDLLCGGQLQKSTEERGNAR